MLLDRLRRPELGEGAPKLSPQSLGLLAVGHAHGHDRHRRLGRLQGLTALQALCERACEPGTELGVVQHELREAVSVDLEQLRVADGLDRGGPGRPREHGQLAEDRAGPERRQDALPALALGDDAHAAGHDRVQAIARVALVEEPLLGLQRHRRPRCGELLLEARRKEPEQRRLAQRSPSFHRRLSHRRDVDTMPGR